MTMKYGMSLKELIGGVNVIYRQGMKMYNGSGFYAAAYCYYEYEHLFENNDLEYHLLSLFVTKKIISTYDKIFVNDYESALAAVDFIINNELPDEFGSIGKQFVIDIAYDVKEKIQNLTVVYEAPTVDS